MKSISNILCLFLLAAACSSAQDTPPMAFLRIVSAVSPGTGNANFLVDGRDLYPDGYALGQTTGAYGVKAGTRNVEVRKAGVETGTTRIDLAEGETMTVIAFAERLPAENPDDPPKWAMRLLRLKQENIERGFGLSIVSVCKAEETAVDLAVLSKGKVEKASVKRLRVSKVDLGRMRGEVMVKAGEKILATVSPDSPGNYVVILYENAEGEIGALDFYDPKFVIAG